MKNEYTITYNAEITVVLREDEERLPVLMSEEYRQNIEHCLLNVWPEHQDVHVRDLKVFISKEGIEE